MTEILSLSFLMDAAILILLIATIVYAARLSLYLKNFRDNKAELQTIINTLSTQITKADEAIKGLDMTVQDSSEDLKFRTNKASSMMDELEMIVESGNSMANRLEALAVKNRKILEGDTSDLDDLRRMTSNMDKDGEYKTRLENVVRDTKAASRAEPAASIFNIRDMDVERGDNNDDGFTLSDDDDILSDAERDLYNALKTKNKKAGKG
jgi:ABC-type transporter Mla subunit MlaD